MRIYRMSKKVRGVYFHYHGKEPHCHKCHALINMGDMVMSTISNGRVKYFCQHCQEVMYH